MASFILWNASFSQKTNELSFFATATQWLYINQGTRDMIAEMLEDLGIDRFAFDEWTINHFLTDYLLDRPISDNWKDIWLHTWEIKVYFTEPIELEMEITDLARTIATDNTSFDDSLAYFPSKCVVIADFYDSESLATAKKILHMVRLLRENEAYIEVFRSQFPQIREYLLKLLHKEYLEQEMLYEKIPEDLSIRQRDEQPFQLIVTVGTFDEEFFEDEAELACSIADIVHQLGGTTTWHERIDPERMT